MQKGRPDFSLQSHYFAIFFVFFAVALCGCTGTPNRPIIQTPFIKIGVVAPMTGPIGHLGVDVERGARLAIEDANAQKPTLGGKAISFVLVTENDAADPRVATTVAQKMVDAQVKGVVGHLNSGTSIPASRIYAQNGVPMISPSATNPMLTRMGLSTSFRVISNDLIQGEALADFAVAHFQPLTVAVIDDRTAYGQGLADAIADKIKATMAIEPSRYFIHTQMNSFATIVNLLATTQPDVVFFAGMDAQAAPLLRQIRSAGIQAQFLTGDGACTAEMIKIAARRIDANLYCSQSETPLERMPGGNSYAARFQQRFHAAPQMYAAYSYDATTALINAMKAANSADVAKYLPTLKTLTFDGVTGSIAFSPSGDVVARTVTIYRYEDGKWIPAE